MNTYLLIDSDMLLYRAAASCMVEVDLGDDCWCWYSQQAQAREFYWTQVYEAMERFSAARPVHCFTAKGMFRRRIMPTYKSGRSWKPPGYGALRTELLAEEGAVCHNEIEADDIISMFARTEPSVIYSGDKDLDQVPGFHAWLEKEPWSVSDEEAELFTWSQALSGDATDGYSGARGYGPVKAAKALADLDIFDTAAVWQRVLEVYEKTHGPGAEVLALQNTQVSRLLRPGEYDFTTKQVDPWHFSRIAPPKSTPQLAKH